MHLTGRVEDINRRHGWTSPKINVTFRRIVELQKRWPIKSLHTIDAGKTFWSSIVFELTHNYDTFKPFGSQSLRDLGHIGCDVYRLTVIYISIRNQEQLWIDLRTET